MSKQNERRSFMTGRNEKLPLSLLRLFTRLIPPLSPAFSLVCCQRKKASFSLSLSLFALSPSPSIVVEHFAEVVLRDQRLNPIALAIVMARRRTD